jgi:hypothetical protein
MTVAEKLLIWLGTGNLVKAHNIILLEKRPLLTLFLTIEVVSKLASFKHPLLALKTSRKN